MHTVLIAEDDTGFRRSLSELLEDSAYRVVTADCYQAALDLSLRNRIDVALLDQRLPDGTGVELCREILGRHDHAKILLMTAYPEFEGALGALRNGAFDFLVKPVDPAAVRFAVEKALAALRLEARDQVRTFEAEHRRGATALAGRSNTMQAVLSLADRAARVRTPVLITGETGTGKSVLARHVHERSPCASEAFVHLNLAAVPTTLLESELFGHERGAFTGADRVRKGAFELAHGGTLFLDEIAEIPVASQARLLAVLDQNEVRRLGGEVTRRVDVRVIAATNVDVERWVAEGRFRNDLSYRLNVIRIDVPPLRERLSDLDELCEHLLSVLSPSAGRELSRLEIEQLRQYHWPGNVRELRNVLERALTLDGTGVLRPSRYVRAYTKGDLAEPAPAATADWRQSLESVERGHVLRVYDGVDGNLAEAARVLRIAESTLRRKLRSYGERSATQLRQAQARSASLGESSGMLGSEQSDRAK